MGCFGGQEIPIPPYQEPPEIPEMPAVSCSMPEFPTFDPDATEGKRRRAEEVRALRDIEAKRKGFRSTLLTGGAGDETPPPLSRPSLLGR
jgi:hypothetical protein